MSQVIECLGVLTEIGDRRDANRDVEDSRRSMIDQSRCDHGAAAKKAADVTKILDG